MQNNFITFLDDIMNRETIIFLETIPFAHHLTDKKSKLNNNYYIRHRIETIKRIRMTSETDAYSLMKMINENYDAARLWSEYINEEMNHDKLFIKDLIKHGYTIEQVLSFPTMDATLSMINYLKKKINSIGSLPAVVYSLVVEWSSERYSNITVEKAENEFSSAHVSGSKAHYGIDEKENHLQMIIDITQKLLKSNNNYNQNMLYSLIRTINVYFRNYFEELHEITSHAVLPDHQNNFLSSFKE